MRPLFFIFLFFISLNAKAQTIATYAGNGSGVDSGDGYAATSAGISQPVFGKFDKLQNYYIADGSGNRVRKISTSGIISNIVGVGSGGFGGDGGPATLALLRNIQGIAIDSTGNIYVSDNNNNRIRRIDFVTGIISTIAGNGTAGFGGDGLPATESVLNDPNGICVDQKGNIYISDYGNSRIRKIDPAGIMSTFAGTGVIGYNGDGGLADTSEIKGSFDVCADDTGNIYIADESNARIRKVDTFGIIHTIAGNGIIGESGDGLNATSAEIEPHCLTFDKFGNLFFSDYYANIIRKINASGIISTVAGNGTLGFEGDGGPATAAEFHDVCGVTTDSCGNLYSCDFGNHRVRKIFLDSTCSIFDSISLELSLKFLSYDCSVYPNPVFCNLIVENRNEIEQIAISNVIGRLVFWQEYHSENASINVSNLPPGIYIVRVTDEEGNVVMRKVLKK